MVGGVIRSYKMMCLFRIDDEVGGRPTHAVPAALAPATSRGRVAARPTVDVSGVPLAFVVFKLRLPTPGWLPALPGGLRALCMRLRARARVRYGGYVGYGGYVRYSRRSSFIAASEFRCTAFCAARK